MNSKMKKVIVINNGHIPRIQVLFDQLTKEQQKQLQDKVRKLVENKNMQQTKIMTVVDNLFSCENHNDWVEAVFTDAIIEVEKISNDEDYVQTFCDNVNKSYDVFSSDLEDNIRFGKGLWIKALGLTDLKVDPKKKPTQKKNRIIVK